MSQLEEPILDAVDQLRSLNEAPIITDLMELTLEGV
jgi:hypothetical protein